MQSFRFFLQSHRHILRKSRKIHIKHINIKKIYIFYDVNVGGWRKSKWFAFDDLFHWRIIIVIESNQNLMGCSQHSCTHTVHSIMVLRFCVQRKNANLVDVIYVLSVSILHRNETISKFVGNNLRLIKIDPVDLILRPHIHTVSQWARLLNECSSGKLKHLSFDIGNFQHRSTALHDDDVTNLYLDLPLSNGIYHIFSIPTYHIQQCGTRCAFEWGGKIREKIALTWFYFAFSFSFISGKAAEHKSRAHIFQFHLNVIVIVYIVLYKFGFICIVCICTRVYMWKNVAVVALQMS